MVLPSSLLEEEDELRTERLENDQPLARAPWATLYSRAQGYNSHREVGDMRYKQNRTS
jgi:hypothetical protein